MAIIEFPENWIKYSLEEVTSKLAVGFVGTCEKYYTDGSFGVMMIRTGDIKENNIDYSSVRYISYDFHESNLKSQLKKGDILIARHGNSGHGVIYNLDKEANALNVVIVRVNARFMNNVFLKYLLDSAYVSKQVKEFSAGSTQSVINTSQLAKLELLCPPLAEQEQLTSVFIDIDECILSLAKLIDKKKVIKQGVEQELLIGKRRLKGFSDEWKSFNLMSGSKIKARIGWQGLKKSEYLDSGYAFLVTGTDFIDGRIQWDTCHFVKRERYVQDENIQIKNGDILVTKDGTLGKTAFVQELNRPATLNSGVFVIRPLQNAYDPEFVYHILSSFVFKEFLDKLSAGSTIVHLYQKDMSKFEFLLPPTIEEQKTIACILTEMDEEIKKIEEKYEKYKLIKQGMMEQLLTGKIRLI